MKKYISVDGISVPIQIQSYKKSKSIKIFCKQGYIKITKPIWYSEKNILVYVKNNIEILNENYSKYIKKIEEKCQKENLKVIMYLGETYIINILRTDKGQGYCIINDTFNVFIPNKVINKEEYAKYIIKNYFKEISKKLLKTRLDYISDIIKIQYTTFRIKDCKTIWGSCSGKGNINFNYKLIMMPIWVIDQIVLHELCHLKHLNHGEKFWDLLYTYCTKVKYLEGKKWIKNNKEFLDIY